MGRERPLHPRGGALADVLSQCSARGRLGGREHWAWPPGPCFKSEFCHLLAGDLGSFPR